MLDLKNHPYFEEYQDPKSGVTSYILTEKGREMLEKECARLIAQLYDYHLIFGKEEVL